MAFPNPANTPSAAQIGYGAAFYIGSGAPGSVTYTLVAEVQQIKPSGITVGEEDVTNLGSPNAVREFTPTLAEYGQIEISGTYSGDASQLLLESNAIARTIFPFKFAFPIAGKNETRTGTGFITKYTPGDISVDKVPSFTCTMRVTGTETVVDA